MQRLWNYFVDFEREMLMRGKLSKSNYARFWQDFQSKFLSNVSQHTKWKE